MKAEFQIKITRFLKICFHIFEEMMEKCAKIHPFYRNLHHKFRKLYNVEEKEKEPNYSVNLQYEILGATSSQLTF